MSPDPEPQAVELEAEQEVDFGRYGRTIAARWWLLVVGAVIGALIGFLVSLSDGKIYKATAQVYLGQPLAPDSAAAVTTSPTTLGLVQAFITSEEAIEKAASAAGLRPSRLRDNVTVRAIPGHVDHQAGLSGAAALDSGHRLLAREDRRRGEPPGETGRGRGRYVHEDEDRHARPAARVHRHAARDRERAPAAARASQKQIVADRSLSPVEKLVALTNLNSEITLAEQRQATLELNRFNTTRALSLAKDIEASRVTATGGGRADGADEPADERARRRLHRPPARDRGGALLGSRRGSHGSTQRLGHARRQDRSRRRPRLRRGEAAPRDAGGDPRLRRSHLRRRRRVARRHGRDAAVAERARPADPARAEPAASAPPSSPATSRRSRTASTSRA